MLVILAAFSLFHLFAGVASLGLAMRLLTAQERAYWRSPTLLRLAQSILWVYPALAAFAGYMSWRAFDAGNPMALPVILTPFLWLLAMGIVFAIVDFAEDGVIGNARGGEPTKES